jgi:hypothetical protein
MINNEEKTNIVGMYISSGGSVELTEASFSSEIAGKSSFVMFKAPW